MAIKLSADEGGEGVAGEINVVPLIDVLFSILTFFVLASIFLTRQQGLPLDLPRQGDPEDNVISRQVTLVIDKNGKYFLDKKPIALKKIGPVAKAFMDKNPNDILIISGDKDVEYRYVVDVLDELRLAKANRIGMAADTE
jgi:biopolymer transport protein ExbD